MILKNDIAMIATNTPIARKTTLLRLLLGLYRPVCGLAHHGFIFGSFRPQSGAADLFVHTTPCYALISSTLNLPSFWLLSAALVIASLAEANTSPPRALSRMWCPPTDAIATVLTNPEGLGRNC